MGDQKIQPENAKVISGLNLVIFGPLGLRVLFFSSPNQETIDILRYQRPAEMMEYTTTPWRLSLPGVTATER